MGNILSESIPNTVPNPKSNPNNAPNPKCNPNNAPYPKSNPNTAPNLNLTPFPLPTRRGAGIIEFNPIFDCLGNKAADGKNESCYDIW